MWCVWTNQIPSFTTRFSSSSPTQWGHSLASCWMLRNLLMQEENRSLELCGKCQISNTCWLTYPWRMASCNSDVCQVPTRHRPNSLSMQRWLPSIGGLGCSFSTQSGNVSLPPLRSGKTGWYNPNGGRILPLTRPEVTGNVGPLGLVNDDGMTHGVRDN